MIDRTNLNQPMVPSTLQLENEIDLKQILRTLLRHKFFIAKISFAALLLSVLYASTRQSLWEGQFEIVLADERGPSFRANQLLKNNPGLSNLIGYEAGKNQLETEVKILESPSVLKPVFDFVKEQKEQRGLNVENWRYADWLQGNLTIELIKGTSVLELAYRDTHKDLILPVIQKISETYQDYSGRDRERGIYQAIIYLDQQINLYRAKSVRSLRAAQEYGIEQNLTALQGEGANDTDFINSLNIEAIRIAASNEIRNINEQLKQLHKLDNKPETLIHIALNVPRIASQGVAQSIDAMDAQLALLRAKYTDKDDSIRRLLEKRLLLIDVLKRQTFGFLYAQRTAAQARLKAAERPKGVLIKYRELLRSAARDEQTLTNLETERQLLALEQARKEEPWELISTPTLLDKPVSPRRKRIVALGFLAGLVTGSGAALLLDRRSDLVYSEGELRSLIPCPLLKHLPANSKDSWTDAAYLLADGPLAEVSGNSAVALIPLGEMPNDQLKAFTEELSLALQGRELVVSADLRQTSKCGTQLLITAPGSATRTQLAQFSQKLVLQGAPVAGWVLLDPDLIIG